MFLATSTWTETFVAWSGLRSNAGSMKAGAPWTFWTTRILWCSNRSESSALLLSGNAADAFRSESRSSTLSLFWRGSLLPADAGPAAAAITRARTVTDIRARRHIRPLRVIPQNTYPRADGPNGRRRYARSDGRARLPRVRLRQPLLRGARRVHASPRPPPRTTDRAVGRDRRTQVPRGRRTGQPRRRQPDLRPHREGGRDARLLPRQPRRQASHRVPP